VIEKPGWTMLLIGGPSGVGKSIAARAIGQRFGLPWLQVDDLRLALQRSRVTLPARTEALYFFEETPDVRRLSAEHLCNGLIAVGEVMSPAIEVVVENHIDQAAPAIIEGDGILPSLLVRPSIRARAGQVRAIFVIEPDEDAILANIVARGRGMVGWSESDVRTDARAKWLHGQWLIIEARRYGMPILAPRPWGTLVERIMMASGLPGT
jgi:2-phosphoglycerate kinase